MSRRLLPVLIILAMLCGCSSRNRLAPADPDDPDKIEQCTGTVTNISHRPNGEVVIHLQPRAEFADMLAPGQRELICEMYATSKDRFEGSLAKLKVGNDVAIYGYYVVDHRHGSRHKLRPITSIDIYPDGWRGS